MRRIFIYALVAMLVPATARAQTTPPQELEELLPDDVSAQVLQRIQDARARGLSSHAMATLAMEGVAKDRSGEEILAAVEALAGDMTKAREALAPEGGTPEAADVEAATAAMRMGVDGWDVSALARSGPSGRSLAVPLLVLGSLVDRGLASDEALDVVLARLEAGATDGDLLGDIPDAGYPWEGGVPPSEAGAAIHQGLAVLQIPMAGAPASMPAVGRLPGAF